MLRQEAKEGWLVFYEQMWIFSGINEVKSQEKLKL